MNNVIVSIKSTQLTDNGPDEMELVTEGKLEWNSADNYVVSYEESELTGMEGTTTLLLVEGPQVTLRRVGKTNSQLVFEVGRRHLSLYETPYGSLSMGVDTRRLKHAMEEHGGVLEIDYFLEVNNLLAGRTRFRMDVRRDKAVRQ